MFIRRNSSSSILTEVVAEEMLLKEESQCEKKKKKKKKTKKKKKKKKARSDSSEEISENAGVLNSDHVKRSSITSLFRRNSSKSGFMGFGESEEIVDASPSHTKKGYFGFGKSTNFLDFDKDTQPKQCDNKQEQEQEKDSEQESVWNQAPSGFKYRVSNMRKQKGQKLVQNCLQTSSQNSIASALSPIAKDPKKLWGWPKKNKGKALFDNESPFPEKAGISLFSSKRYQAMPEAQWEDSFGGFGVDPTTLSSNNLLTRLKHSAKKIKADWDPFADVKELANGVKEVVLEEEESEDTEDSENSSSTSDSSSSSEDS